ncbi:hypothetical protein VTO73DRAFT_14452 [Trametes versicolor]
MPSPDVVTCFGTAQVRYTCAEDNVPEEYLEWDSAMVLISEVCPLTYALIVARPSDTGEEIVFSSIIKDDWLFNCDEACRTVKWKTPAQSMRKQLRFRMVEDFWLFVCQFSEARTHALREKTESEDQLRAVEKSFRSFLVVATTMNATNRFDGGPDPHPSRFGGDIPAQEDDDEDT